MVRKKAEAFMFIHRPQDLDTTGNPEFKKVINYKPIIIFCFLFSMI